MSIQSTTKRPKVPTSTPAQGPNKADKKSPAAKKQKTDTPAPAKEERAKGPKRAGSRQVAQSSPVAAQLQQKVQANAPDAPDASATHAHRAKEAPHGHHHHHGHHAADSADHGQQTQVARAFKKLTTDGKFSAKDKRALAAEIRENGISEKEAKKLEGLEGTKHAGKLDEKGTTRLSNTVTRLLAEYHAQPETDRKEILKDLKTQDLSWTASSLAGDLGLELSEPRKYTLGAPVDDTNTDFEGRTTPAKKYQMNIDNRNIDIIVEEPRASSGQFNEKEIAEALSQVRPDLLEHVERVELINESKGTASMRTNYYKESGTIEVLPVVSDRSVTQGAHILNHEIGHLQTRATLGYDDANWQTYAKAIEADNRYPSRYAMTKPSEDFSEFVTLHEIFRDTPEEASFRALFANRYAAAGDLIS